MSLPPPLNQCSKIFMLHMNFGSRAREHGDWPSHPVYHLKPPSTLTVQNSPIYMPPGVQTMLGEAEIAVVIGRTARHVSEDDALGYVSHLAAANDVTIFDYGWSDAPSLVRSKGFDSFTPLGPLVPINHVDAQNVSLRLWVNGVLRQEAHSSDLIFPFARLIAELSAIMTLNPGDVLLTGTPSGAPVLEVGDEVVVELGDVSRSVNSVEAATNALNSLLPPPRITPRARGVAVGAACHRLSGATVKDLQRLQEAGIDAVSDLGRVHGADVRPIRLSGGPPDFAGHAFTLRQVPARTASDGRSWPAPARATLEALRAIGPGELIVAEGGLSENSTRILAARAAMRSAGGVTAELPSTPQSQYLPVAINTPVVINGNTVMPGDLILSEQGQTLLIAGETADKIIEAIS